MANLHSSFILFILSILILSSCGGDKVIGKAALAIGASPTPNDAKSEKPGSEKLPSPPNGSVSKSDPTGAVHFPEAKNISLSSSSVGGAVGEATKTVASVCPPVSTTSLTPTVIHNAQELAAMKNGHSYILGNDITLSGNWISLVGESIILDGADHRIFGLSANNDSGDYNNGWNSGVGLFARLDCSLVRNLRFESPQIIATHFNTGVVTGYSKVSTIDNVIVNSGTVDSWQGVGMLVGSMMSSIISNSRVVGGTVTHHANASGTGGIVGMVNYMSNMHGFSTLYRVSSDATLIGLGGTAVLGSLVGWVAGDLHIEQASALGPIQAGSSAAAGLIGFVHPGTDGDKRPIHLEMTDVLSNFVDGRSGTKGRFSGLIAQWSFAHTHSIKLKNIFLNANPVLIAMAQGDLSELPVLEILSSYAANTTSSPVELTNCYPNTATSCASDVMGYLVSKLSSGFNSLSPTAVSLAASYLGWDFINTWNLITPNKFPTLRN